MSLTSPNLDNRTFEQLVAEARRQIEASCPDWTDLSAGDPGMILLELFAYLTEGMIYQLNQLPEKAYVEFLRLMGVRRYPPTAARAHLRFTRKAVGDKSIAIPRGTRVSVGRSDAESEAIVFTTVEDAAIPPGEGSVEGVLAYHCQMETAELAGRGTNLPGQSLVAAHSPLIAPTGDERDLVVAVEPAPNDEVDRDDALLFGGKVYRIWREVGSFVDVEPERPFVYVADRLSGTITFAPAVQSVDQSGGLDGRPRPLGAVPPLGAEIRLWYRWGGGPTGNVAASTLTALRDQIAGVEVTNPGPATGGRPAESVENALIRGPQSLHATRRAVTARDYEQVAIDSGGVSRSRAFTKAEIWPHAVPGTVAVVLVPDVPEDEAESGGATVASLRQYETPETLQRVAQALDERRPLGTTCEVSWARYKSVRVAVEVVVHAQVDLREVEGRIRRRLDQTINPLPRRTGSGREGWGFGQALRESNVWDIALGEPGVRWVNSIRLLVDEAPDKDVATVAADPHKESTWYAGSGDTLYRSLDDGDGWEPAGRFPGETIDLARPQPDSRLPGLLAVVTRLDGSRESRLHVSEDFGETWSTVAQTESILDLAWLLRDNRPTVLLATDRGLYERSLRQDAGPVLVVADRDEPDRGIYSVVADVDARGNTLVAVAAQPKPNGSYGIYLSHAAGRSQTFELIGPPEVKFERLAIHRVGARTFLWAGTTAAGGSGQGWYRCELLGQPPYQWSRLGEGWVGGSCLDIAFDGARALSASFRGGVLQTDALAGSPVWQRPDVEGSGLPRGQGNDLLPIEAVAVARRRPGAGDSPSPVMAGGPRGVYRSDDGGTKYRFVAAREFAGKVTLPRTWLFCSGEHQVRAMYDQ